MPTSTAVRSSVNTAGISVIANPSPVVAAGEVASASSSKSFAAQPTTSPSRISATSAVPSVALPTLLKIACDGCFKYASFYKLSQIKGLQEHS